MRASRSWRGRAEKFLGTSAAPDTFRANSTRRTASRWIRTATCTWRRTAASAYRSSAWRAGKSRMPHLRLYVPEEWLREDFQRATGFDAKKLLDRLVQVVANFRMENAAVDDKGN